AIVAREYKLPAIVGASGALGILKTGSLVRMRIDGGIEHLAAERRRHERVPASARVTLRWQEGTTDGVLRDLRESGALVEVGEEVGEGQGVSIRTAPDREEVPAKVVRRDSSGRFGLAFERLLAKLSPPGTRG